MEIGSNEDLSTEILLRLPVKSVLNFKSVSKLWLSIASTTRFRQIHASRRHRAPTGLFFVMYHTRGVYGFYPLNFDTAHQIKPKMSIYVPRIKLPPRHIHLTCTSSCNGLQLLRSLEWLSDHHTYYVYNPTTMEYRLLNNIPSNISDRKYVCASLAFDPSESLHYKVIFLWRQQHTTFNEFQFEIYSSTTGTCKAPVSNTFVGDFDFHDNSRGIFCNSAIYWLLSKPTWVLSKPTSSIFYFNVHTERLNELPTPPSAPKIHYFGQSQGRIQLVNSDHPHFSKSSVLYVYELKRDYSGWFLKYQVEITHIASVLPNFNERGGYANFLSIIQDEEEDDLMLVVLACELVEINPKKKTTKRLCEYVQWLPPNSQFSWSYWALWTYWFNAHQFIPTLTFV